MTTLGKLKKTWDKASSIVAWFPIFIAVCSICVMLIDSFYDGEYPKLKASFQLVTTLFTAVLLKVLIKILYQMEHHHLNHVGTLRECLDAVVNACGKIKSVEIVAYTATNYRDFFKEKDVGSYRLLLCRANEFRAWDTAREEDLNAYQTELEETIKFINKRTEGKDEIRYLEDRIKSHFCIVNKKYVIVGLVSLRKETGMASAHGDTKGEKNCYVLDTTMGDVVERYVETFDTWFERAFSDSGLKIKDTTCNFCKRILTAAKRNVDKPLVPVGSMDSSDFLILRDVRPISEMHLLLVCRYHVLCLYDYFRRRNTKYGTNTIDELNGLIARIRRSVKEVFGDDEDIVVFEHGGLTAKKENAASVTHLHLHVILRSGLDGNDSDSQGGPTNHEDSTSFIETIAFDDAIALREKKFCNVMGGWDKTSELMKNLTFTRYSTLQDFAEDRSQGMKDYFLIWDLKVNGIYVYPMTDFGEMVSSELQHPKEYISQYLRRLFFNRLAQEKRKYIYGLDFAKEDGIWKNDAKYIPITKDMAKKYQEFADAFNGKKQK